MIRGRLERSQVWRGEQRAIRSTSTFNAYSVLVVGTFILLATVYSVVTPLFEAPDEVWHFRFITHMVDTGTLPIQDPANPGPWRQEGSQPPLYYLLAAPFVASIDNSNVELVIKRNPHAAVGRAGADGNVNFVVHTARERFPWQGVALAAHMARFVSVLLGAVTVALTYLLTLEVFEGNPLLALGAAVLVALNPQFLFISGAVNNDNLVIALATLTLLLLLRLVNNGVSGRRLAVLGIVIGLAALSKLSGLGLWGLVGMVLLVYHFGLRIAEGKSAIRNPKSEIRNGMAWQRHGLLALVRWYLVVFGFATAVAGWWYARNWALYGDPTGLNVMLQIFGHRTGPVSPLQLIREFEGLRWSFWAVFGWFNLLPPGRVHWFFDLLSLAGVVGLIMFVSQRIRARDWATLGRLAILVIWFVITAVGLGRWTMLTTATQGRLLFPAISVVGVLLFTGLATLIPGRYRSRLVTALGVWMAGIALYIAFGVIWPAYAPPPALSAEQLDSIPHPEDDVVFGNRIALVGYQVTPDVVRPGDDLTVTLYWRGLIPVETDYSLFLHLIGENDVSLSQRDSYPGRGTAATSEWTPGVTFVDTYRLHVPTTAGAPQSAWVALGLYDLVEQRRLALPDGTERFALKAVRLVPAMNEASIPNPVDFDLSGHVKLAGYELSTRAVSPGETLDLALYWQALADMDQNYTVFTQLLSDDLVIWAQDDAQPLRGDYPTSRWTPGEVVRDTYRLTVKPEAPAGVHHLEIGMYLLETGERLYRTDEPTANSIRLAGIRVLPAN
ncbi:MAG: ArnT family glycosyltransferase [Anaerolineae bacterium]